MEAELKHSLAVCEAEILSFIAPLEQVGVHGSDARTRGWGLEACDPGRAEALATRPGSLPAKAPLARASTQLPAIPGLGPQQRVPCA